jgi:hypothetical protein
MGEWLSPVVLGLVTLLTLGCASEGGSTGPGLDVSGSYEGSVSFSGGQVAIVTLHFTFTQASTLVNGSYATGSRDFGSVSGSVAGTNLVVQSRSTPFATTCDYEGSIASGAEAIAGTVKCSDSTEGAFSVTRA